MDLIKFLRNEDVDFKNRTLSDIWAYDDSQIEVNHDYIQLRSPLNKPSRHSFHGVYLSDNIEISEIQTS